MSEKKKKSNIGYKIVIGICILVAGFCLFELGKIGYTYYHDRQEYYKLQNQVKTEYGLDIDWKKLEGINKDIKAWIYCDKTVIDYPVVHNPEASYDYYLHRNVYKDYIYAGSIFMDVNTKGDFSDFNTIIYGHHMKDGSMFHVLTDYTDQKYYEEHPEFIIVTPNQAYKLKLFAGQLVQSDDKQIYGINFATRDEKQALLDRLITKSTFKAKDVNVTPDDHIVTLSTCSYGSIGNDENERYIVAGVLEPTELAKITITPKEPSLWEILTPDKLIMIGIGLVIVIVLIIVIRVIRKKNKKINYDQR